MVGRKVFFDQGPTMIEEAYRGSLNHQRAKQTNTLSTSLSHGALNDDIMICTTLRFEIPIEKFAGGRRR